MFPKASTRPCCKNDAPDFPSRDPSPSIAAFPLTYSITSYVSHHTIQQGTARKAPTKIVDRYTKKVKDERPRRTQNTEVRKPA